MPAPLSPQTIAVVKATVPALAEHGSAIADAMYRQLFEDAEAGPVMLDWLKANTPLEQADFYICGPRPFLRAFAPDLTGAGVPSGQIHYDLFGPTDETFAA